MANLTPDERAVLTAIEQAAAIGARCPTADDILEIVPRFESHTSTVKLIDRLVRKGAIAIQRYQRARVVTILATGQRTAEPKCLTPHWRHVREMQHG